MPFTIAGTGVPDEAETDEDGNASFGNLRPGAYEVRGGTPDDVARSAVFCTPAAAPGTRFPFTQTDTAGIEIDLAAGDDVVCDWYVVSGYRDAAATPIAAPGRPGAGDATLTVYGLLCPEGYAGNDYVAICSGAPAAGAQFLVKKSDSWAQLPAGGGYATADEGGAAWFALGALAPGAVRLFSLIPDDLPAGGGFTVPRVSCTTDDGRRVLDAMPLESRSAGPVFEIRVAAGDRVRCDAYFLPLPPP